jgi:hypothetical protein
MIDTKNYRIVEREDFNEYWRNNILECIAFNDGWTLWYNEKFNLSKTTGPAVIKPDGTSFWYLNGLLHNENGPAIIRNTETENWIKGVKI